MGSRAEMPALESTADPRDQRGLVDQVVRADLDHPVSRVFEKLSPGEILEPARAGPAVVIALVLQQKARLAIAQVGVPDASGRSHRELHLWLGQAARHEHEPEQSLAR